MDALNESPPDPAQLELQLRLAIEEDEKYKRENAAKFRAMEQSKTYEEFRNIVLVSHLKPLGKQDSLNPNSLKLIPWNKSATKKQNKAFDCDNDSSGFSELLEMETRYDDLKGREITRKNFNNLWGSLSNNIEERLELLKKAISTKKIFEGHELSSDQIGEILETLNCYWERQTQVSEETMDLTLKTMAAISSTPRFALHMLFLSEKEKNVIRQLVEKLKLYLEEKSKDCSLDCGIGCPLEILDVFKC